MMADHTPGPWRVEKNPDDEVIDPAVMAGEYYVATVHDACSSEGCWDADARLIAAAPDLLAALEDVVGLLKGGFPPNDIAVVRALKEAGAVLGKARGESPADG